MTASGQVSGTAAREVFADVFKENKDPEAIVREKGLAQVSDDSQLRDWAGAAIAETPKAVADYKGGNEKALGAIVGAVMKKSRGKANPGRINDLLKELLK
jgi:aspartyl-tRNA(Asn)/glutamyl-tRNA(Gln) amidotransferase subunit B